MTGGRAAALRLVAIAQIVALSSCTGVISDGTGNAVDRPGRVAPAPAEALDAPITGVRRLSRAEYARTVRVVLGVEVGDDVSLLPPDTRSPYDNDYANQAPSAAVVEGLRVVAERVANRFLADTAARDRAVGCAPSGAGDVACLREFVERVGRRLLRRPLDATEVDELSTLSSFSVAAGDFYVGVGLVLQALLQDVQLAYHVEMGTPTDVPGLRKLTQWELASRLSFFLWGSAPDDALLDRAAAGELATDAQLRAEAERMLLDPRAADQVDRFHAMWLGYDALPHSAELSARMHEETRALIDRVVWEEQLPWTDLLTASETWIDATLAAHYGFAGAGSTTPAWVPYPSGSGRRGILSHATVLSNGSKFGDTSPTQRGIFIRERLLCQTIPPPPPDLAVDVDEPPAAADPSACKWERYEQHRQGACAGCHSLTDPVGFGLEQFDAAGRFRTHETANPECEIRADGELTGFGAFTGPAQLGERLLETGGMNRCVVTQLVRFTIGRGDRDEDAAMIDALTEDFESGGLRFRELLVAVASSPRFRYRRLE